MEILIMSASFSHNLSRSALFLIYLLALFSLSACSNQSSKEPSMQTSKPSQPPIAVIDTSLGTIKIQCMPDKAPKTCANFIALAKKGFYNGLSFHRVIPNFMIQGGCPKGDGTGDPGYKIPAEFNDTKHVPGIVSMARAADPNSAGSQFFICVATCPWLDGQYTAFAKVIEGQDVANKISNVPRGPNDKPNTRVAINSITIQE